MTTIKRVLLVDDNEADSVFHEIILRRAGFTGSVTVCESAQIALDYLQRNRPQWPELLLVDINMPGMDGFKFVERLQSQLPSPSPCIMMLTSSNAQSDRDRARLLPIISGYLVKPLTVEIATRLLAGDSSCGA
jgi:CheY-like chemotaxis protein